jgi:hypothetical protein
MEIQLFTIIPIAALVVVVGVTIAMDTYHHHPHLHQHLHQIHALLLYTEFLYLISDPQTLCLVLILDHHRSIIPRLGRGSRTEVIVSRKEHTLLSMKIFALMFDWNQR